ncbi:trypsin-like peptidase domain-containing protein [Vulcanibacillus modesticaldus]|nr:trypsin-like peptidase domain-containing protein [Vulcanibacillus modesticaldus]
MKREIKGFIFGFLFSSLLISNSVLAEGLTKTIQVMFNSINIEVNGQKVAADNILYNGTTYVPLRAISEMLNKDVTWDGSTNTAGINDKNFINDRIKVIAEDPYKQLKTTEEVAELADSIVLIESYDYNGNLLGTGSGIFINNEGYIITNNHVIEDSFKLSVITNEDENGKEYKDVQIINYDETLDLALLKINTISKGIHISSTKPKLGSNVVAIGSPLGLFNTVSEGIVSGFRDIGGSKYIQTSAPISPGSSGGALINMYGEVIGVVTAKIVDGENINLAIPNDVVLNFIDNSAESKRKIQTIEYSNAIYIGEVNNGLEHGYGKTIWFDGDIYKGYYQNGMKSGQGTYYWADGDIYVGNWVNDDRTGIGRYYFASEGTIYFGEFVEGRQEGYGSYHYLDGSVVFGKFNNNELVGQYAYFDTDGKVYVNEIRNGVPVFIK